MMSDMMSLWEMVKAVADSSFPKQKEDLHNCIRWIPRSPVHCSVQNVKLNVKSSCLDVYQSLKVMRLSIEVVLQVSVSVWETIFPWSPPLQPPVTEPISGPNLRPQSFYFPCSQEINIRGNSIKNLNRTLSKKNGLFQIYSHIKNQLVRN